MVRMLSSNWRSISLYAFVIFIIFSLHAQYGTPNGSSHMFNLPWFDAFRNAFWAGDLYPRFLPDLWFGMGAFDFYFYGPLPFWLASTLGETSCSGCQASLVFSLGGAWMVILSGGAFFLFARRFFSARWASFGGLVYAVLPYHYLMDWYVRQSVGEVASAMILPLLALATTKLLEQQKGGALFALSFAALALSHLPTALIFIHFLTVLLVWMAASRDPDWVARFNTFRRFALWGTLGAGLSAFYWLPAIGLLDSVSPEMLATEYYDPTGWLLLDGRPETVPDTASIVKFCALLVLITATCASLILWQAKNQTLLRVWIIAPSVFTLFLMSVFSFPIWEFWILNKVQFPWRTLIISDLAIGLSAIIIAKNVIETQKGSSAWRARGFAGLGLCTFFLAYGVQTTRTINSVEQSQILAGEFQPIGVSEYIPPKTLQPALTEFRAIVTPEHSGSERYALFAAAVREHYERAVARMQSDAPGATLKPLINDRLRLSLELAASKELQLPLAAWPHWRARTAQGDAVTVSSQLDSGFLSISLPEGRSEVDLYLVETAPQKLGTSLSTFSLLILLLWLGKTSIERDRRRKKAFSTSPD